MRWAALAALVLLAACGAEAPPEPPQPSGVTLGGEVQIGVKVEL